MYGGWILEARATCSTADNLQDLQERQQWSGAAQTRTSGRSRRRSKKERKESLHQVLVEDLPLLTELPCPLNPRGEVDLINLLLCDDLLREVHVLEAQVERALWWW